MQPPEKLEIGKLEAIVGRLYIQNQLLIEQLNVLTDEVKRLNLERGEDPK